MTSPLQQVINALNLKSELDLKEFIRSKSQDGERVRFVHSGFLFEYDTNGFRSCSDYKYMVTTRNHLNIIF